MRRIESIGPCTVESPIAQGATRAVYKASHPVHGAVAVAVPIGEGRAQEHFRAFVDAHSRLVHPHIVPILEHGECGSQPYAVMPFIDGEDLAGILRKEAPLGLELTLALLRQVAEAIDHAHELGIVHGSLRPDSVLVDWEGKVHLLGFGIAEGGDPAPGNPRYQPPELILGKAATNASDVYVVGLLAFEMLTGRSPHPHTTLVEMMRARTQDEAPFLRDLIPDLSPAVDEAVARALTIRESERPALAMALAESIRTVLEDPSAVSAREARLRMVTLRDPVPYGSPADEEHDPRCRLPVVRGFQAGEDLFLRVPAASFEERMRCLGRDLRVVWAGRIGWPLYLVLEAAPEDPSTSGAGPQHVARLEARFLRFLDADEIVSFRPALEWRTQTRDQLAMGDLERHLGPIPRKGDVKFYEDCQRERGVSRRLRVMSEIIVPPAKLRVVDIEERTQTRAPGRWRRLASTIPVLSLQSPSKTLTEKFMILSFVEVEGVRYLLVDPTERTVPGEYHRERSIVRLVTSGVVASLDAEEFETVSRRFIDRWEDGPGPDVRDLPDLAPEEAQDLVNALQAPILRLLPRSQPVAADSDPTPADHHSVLPMASHSWTPLTNFILVQVDTEPVQDRGAPPPFKVMGPGTNLVIAARWVERHLVFVCLRSPESPIIRGRPGDAIDFSSMTLERVLPFEMGSGPVLVLRYLPALSDPESPPRVALRMLDEHRLVTLTDEELIQVRRSDEADLEARPAWTADQLIAAFRWSRTPSGANLRVDVATPHEAE